MSKYGNIVYGGAKYGDTPKLTYSVEPMSINVIRFQEIYVYWQQPKGNFSRFRLVRNQLGFPETAEDGYIIYEVLTENGSNLEGLIPISLFKDGEDNLHNENFIAIIPNKNIYYRVFLYTDQNVWVKAGEISAVVPKDTNVTERMLNLLPRTLVSDVLSPFGVVPLKNDLVKSDIYKFLDGIAFTYEQFLTETDLVRPRGVSETGPASTIEAEFYSSGLELEPNLPFVSQRRLIREANYLYSTKGTKLGLENYCESLTGFAPTIDVSPNLMLNVQDSTFYRSVGNWQATNATITSTDEVVPDLSPEKIIDKVYTLKIVATNAGTITLGEDNPLLQGIPLKKINDYRISYKVKSPASSGSVQMSVNTYDKEDNLVVNSALSNGLNANNSWQEDSFVLSGTPDDYDPTVYATLTLSWDSAGTYYVDQVFVGESIYSDYSEARAIEIYMNASSINYIENPSFEVDDSNWTLTNLSFATDSFNIPGQGYPGSNSGQFTLTNTSWEVLCDSILPVEPGKYFNFSMYSYSEDLFDMTMYLDVYDDSNVLLDTFSSVHMMEGTWMRNYVRGLMTFESNASYAKIRFGGTGNIGDVFYLDMIQAELTYKPTDYFDGSLPTEVGAVWSGTANASATHLYPRRDIKILRLAQTLSKWTPINSWWRLSTAVGLEYTNLDV